MTPTPTPTPTVTPTITPTPSVTCTVTPSTSVTPTPTPFAELDIHSSLYATGGSFPLWQSSTYILNDYKGEQITPSKMQIRTGDIVYLSATQNLYSFDYYAIYPPHKIYNAGAYWYITRAGFTASYDPNTSVVIGELASVTGTNGKIRAIYR